MKVLTHNGVFHADEVTAVALLKVFGHSVEVERVPHQTNLDEMEFDMAVDIGLKYDGKKRFDHHQYEGGKSSAGLILDYLNVGSKYDNIAKMVKMIDMNDTNEKKAKQWEIPSIISKYNESNVYGKDQDKAFFSAVEVMVTVIKSLKNSIDDRVVHKKVCDKAVRVEGLNDVVEISKFVQNIGFYFNKKVKPDIGAVMWKNEETGQWNAQVTTVNPFSRNLYGKRFLESESMDFVHKNGFFAVAKTKEVMIEYLKNGREEKLFGKDKEKIDEIYKEHHDHKLSDGEALDEVLLVLENANPTLRQKIIDSDGDEFTDEEALEYIRSFFNF